MRCIRRSIWIGLALSIGCGLANGAEGPGVRPQRGQSPEQMERDKTECLAVALAATGGAPPEAATSTAAEQSAGQAPAAESPAPPSAPPTASAQPPEAKGGMAETAPAKPKGLFGGLRRVEDASGTEEEPPPETSAGIEKGRTVFDKAYAECLSARGYTVN